MILERIAIDFRCRGCSTVCRLEAELDKIIADQLPPGWVLENVGVSCVRCADGLSAEKEIGKKREEGLLRTQTATITSLESPTVTAASPLVSDTCTRCHLDIGEMQSWRPDPLAAVFAKAHRQCLDELKGETL